MLGADVDGQINHNVSARTKIASWVLVIDTSFILSHLHLVSKLVDAYERWGNVVMLPWATIMELDGLKKSVAKITHKDAHGIEKTVTVGMLARRANTWCLETMGRKAKGLWGQMKEEVYDPEAAKGDAAILDCCRYVNGVMHFATAILSNDKNLCLKALVYHIKVVTFRGIPFTADGIMSSLQGDGKNFQHPGIWSTPEDAEKPVAEIFRAPYFAIAPFADGKAPGLFASKHANLGPGFNPAAHPWARGVPVGMAQRSNGVPFFDAGRPRLETQSPKPQAQDLQVQPQPPSVIDDVPLPEEFRMRQAEHFRANSAQSRIEARKEIERAWMSRARSVAFTYPIDEQAILVQGIDGARVLLGVLLLQVEDAMALQVMPLIREMWLKSSEGDDPLDSSGFEEMERTTWRCLKPHMNDLFHGRPDLVDMFDSMQLLHYWHGWGSWMAPEIAKPIHAVTPTTRQLSEFVNFWNEVWFRMLDFSPNRRESWNHWKASTKDWKALAAAISKCLSAENTA